MNASTEHDVIRFTAAHSRPNLAHPPRYVGCSSCAMRTLCMPADLDSVDLEGLETIIGVRRVVRRGEALFRADDSFGSLYAVRSGSFKTVVMHRDGGEQVTGLYLPGDPLGLDGISEFKHACDAIALEDSSVCVIPFSQFDEFCREVKPMQRHLYKMMGRAIVRESNLTMMLGTMTAEQRVAAFLLDLSNRFQARGFSPTSFCVRMTREEMGSYLGIKLETVSRMFSKFQKDRLIETRGKSITLIDPASLARI